MTNEVENWLRALPDKAIEGELEDLRAEREQIDKQIEVREQALAMKRSFSVEEGEQSDAQSASSGVRVMSPPFRGREAIRKVIAQTPERTTWTIPDMLDAILKRGWIANTHSVQVNLSRMHHDGELGKDGVGVYVVPADQDNLLASNGSEAQE